jgi:ParB family transcriptional regulator, chromosome partitioning protein
MARKGGLGKGLDALLPSDDTAPTASGDTTSFVPISAIIPNPRQPRHFMSEDGLQELAASIREHGILQPLLVTHEPQTNQYVLVAGERRLRAAQIAGLNAVPILERQATEQQRLELALIENVQRADLTPLETAEAYRQLSDEFNMSHEIIATRVGKSRVTITNTLRLLKLPESVRQAIAEEAISEGHARALLGLNSPQAQAATLATILKQGLNVRQTEQLVRKINGERPTRQPKAETAPEIRELEERLRTSLGTKVTMRHGKRGGNIVIHYYSNEELDTIIANLTKE